MNGARVLQVVAAVVFTLMVGLTARVLTARPSVDADEVGRRIGLLSSDEQIEVMARCSMNVLDCEGDWDCPAEGEPGLLTGLKVKKRANDVLPCLDRELDARGVPRADGRSVAASAPASPQPTHAPFGAEPEDESRWSVPVPLLVAGSCGVLTVAFGAVGAWMLMQGGRDEEAPAQG